MTPALSIRNLTKTYKNGLTALKSIDLDVQVGDFFALLGPNGAGKSTTIGIVSSLINKTGGKVFIFGKDSDTEFAQARAYLGLVPQEFNFNMFEPVLEIVVNQAGYYGIERRRAHAAAEGCLRRLGLWEKRNTAARELSGGMKRRLMIARALLHEPRLLVLDEPTTGLDPQVRQEIWQRLEELRRQSRLTILLSTHYMEEAEKLCDRLLIINRGRIVATGSPSDLISQYVSHYALEVRDPRGLPLHPLDPHRDGARAVARTGAHFYFAESPEQLTPLMKFYEGRRMLLRPSTLEDAFLDLVGEDDWKGEMAEGV